MAHQNFDALFSGHAAAYAQFRPRYPAALFAALAARAPARRAAWDCGTGNGQAALGLADHFERVLATDVSAEQLAQATPHPRVTYRHLVTEPRDLGDASFDLVTVAQAAHWFDLPRFYATVTRVLAPGGVLALWCYSLLEVAPPIDALVRELHDETLAPDWPPPRALVMNGYRDLPLPFPEVTDEITAELGAATPAGSPRFAIEQELSLAGLQGYLATWSAVQQQRRRTGSDPLAALAPQLAHAWGDPQRARVVRWPLHLRVAQKPR